MTEQYEAPALVAVHRGGESLPLRARAGVMPRELARDWLLDTRVRKLPLKLIGALLLIRAHQDCGTPLLANRQQAAAMLKTTPREFDAIFAALAQGDQPLLCEIDGCLHAQPFGQQLRPAISQARSEAAHARWSMERHAKQALAALAKAPRRKKKADLPAPLMVTPKAALSQQAPEPFLPPGQNSAAAGPAPIKEAARSVQAGLFEEIAAPLVSEEDVLAVKRDNVPYAKLSEMFGRICTSLPGIKAPVEWNDARKRTLRQRWMAKTELDWWEKFYADVEESDFLTGRGRTNFRASFDWIINSSNFQKIIEGNYANKSANKQALFGGGTSQFKVGSYGGHSLGESMPWDTDEAPDVGSAP